MIVTFLLALGTNVHLARAQSRSSGSQSRSPGRKPLAPASRQPQRPTISPYLNLANSNGSTASNYFQRVRPELQFRQSLATQGQQLQDLQRMTTGLQMQMQPSPTPISQLSPTGHTATYFNLGSYYPGGRQSDRRR